MARMQQRSCQSGNESAALHASPAVVSSVTGPKLLNKTLSFHITFKTLFIDYIAKLLQFISLFLI